MRKFNKYWEIKIVHNQSIIPAMYVEHPWENKRFKTRLKAMRFLAKHQNTLSDWEDAIIEEITRFEKI